VKDNFYKNGITKGKLQQLYSRNQFTICKEKFVQIKDVLANSFLLQEAASLFSNLGQGYDRCIVHSVAKQINAMNTNYVNNMGFTLPRQDHNIHISIVYNIIVKLILGIKNGKYLFFI